MKIYSKKGLEATVLVGMVITIIGLIAVGTALANITGIIPGSITKETCHASVVARGLDLQGYQVGTLAELKCKTEYKCLTMGGDCPKGYEKISVYDEEDINKELANAMYDCWWMLGEGKIPFFGTNALEKKDCVFCSIIHFDERIRSTYPALNGTLDYMMKNNVPGKSQTYFDYIFTSENQKNVPTLTIDTKQDYVLNFMMTTTGWIEKNWGKIATSVALVGVTIYTGGVGTIALTLVGTEVVGGAVWTGLGIAKKGPAGEVVFTLVPFKSESIKSFGCQNIESIP